LIHELKKKKGAQLRVTNTQAPEVCTSLKLAKTQTCCLQQMIRTTAGLRLLQWWERAVPLLEYHPASADIYRRFRQRCRS